MTNEERLTAVNRASKLFQEWIYYMKKSGTDFNLPPRQEFDDMATEWNGKFMESLDKALDNLVDKDD